MANAYKCDGCGEYYDGDPRKVALYESDEMVFNPDADLVVDMELCPQCKDDVVRDITLRVNE